MWTALNDIAAERRKTVHDVILEINRGRKEHQPDRGDRRLYRGVLPRSTSSLPERKKPRRSGAQSVGTVMTSRSQPP
jgi:hypothetical protein